MGRRARVLRLRVAECTVWRIAPEPDPSVPGLSEVLQRDEGNRDGADEARASGLGDCHLPDEHGVEGTGQHEAAAGPGHHAEGRVAPRAPAPAGVGGEQRPVPVRRPGGSGRSVLRRQAGQHEQRTAEGTGRRGPGAGDHDGGCGGEGPGDEPSGGAGDRQHRPGHLAGLRGRARQPGRRTLTRTTRRRTGAVAGSTRPSNTARRNTSGISKARRSTPTASRASGPCSSGRTRGRSTD